jgi:hypothetical protein
LLYSFKRCCTDVIAPNTYRVRLRVRACICVVCACVCVCVFM